MNKEKNHAFRKDIFLLGRRKSDGKRVWLEKQSWDCDWYWGFGYMETYTNDEYPHLSRDIISHTHFDSEILHNGKTNAFDYFKEYFTETPLTDDEIWLLCDYMTTFYTLRQTAELFDRGNSHYTGRATIDDLKRVDIENDINQNMLPKLFAEIEKLLTPKGE